MYWFIFELLIILHHLFVPLEKKESPPLSTTAAFSTATLSTASYMNGGTPSMPPPDFPKVEDPLNQGTEPESQPRPFSRNPSHPLLSIHHTLYEDEEEQNRRDILARPGELIAAGECWRKMQINTCTHTHTQMQKHLEYELKHKGICRFLGLC